MVPCKCYLIKWLLTCVLFLLQEALVLTSCGIWHIWECCLHRGKCLSCCVSFQWLRSSPCSSYELDLSTSFLVTCYCHGTKPTVLLTYFEEKVAQLGGSLKALNFFPQLLMERKVMFWFLSLSCSVTDFCKHQTLVCVCVCVCVSHSVMSDSLWPHGHRLPGSSIHGIYQVRMLQCVAISSSRGSSQHQDRTWVSCTAGRFFTI